MLGALEKIVSLISHFAPFLKEKIESTFVCNSETNYLPMVLISNLDDTPISLSKLFIEYRGIRVKEIDFTFDIKYNQFSLLKPHSQQDILLDDEFSFGVKDMTDNVDRELKIIVVDSKNKKHTSKMFISDEKICFNSFCRGIDM